MASRVLWGAWALAAVCAVAVAPGHAQAARAVVADTAALGQGPGGRGCMLLERTIFQVDVLTLDLRFGPETAARIRALVDAGAGRDTVAAVAMDSRNAFARITFVRDVGMDRFLDGVRDDIRNAAEAGIIDRGTFRSVSESLPRWYGFLEERGVREGDELLYRIRGDTLHSAYRSVAGEWLLHQTDVGPERRLSVLGSYLAPGSSFREALVDDLVGTPDGC